MTQVSLMADECRAAIHEAKALKANPLEIHEDLSHAFRLKIKIGEIEQEIADRHAALDAELLGLREEIKMLNEAKDRILQEHADAGNMEEAGYHVKTLVRKENRKPDMDKIRRHEDDWNILVSLEVKRVKENYVPNQTALKAVFGKQYEAFLTPAKETVIGYDVEPVAQMPEQGSAEVEP